MGTPPLLPRCPPPHALVPAPDRWHASLAAPASTLVLITNHTRHLCPCSALYPEDYDFSPRSFLLPEMMEAFEAELAQAGQGGGGSGATRGRRPTFILKLDNGSMVGACLPDPRVPAFHTAPAGCCVQWLGCASSSVLVRHLHSRRCPDRSSPLALDSPQGRGIKLVQTYSQALAALPTFEHENVRADSAAACMQPQQPVGLENAQHPTTATPLSSLPPRLRQPIGSYLPSCSINLLLLPSRWWPPGTLTARCSSTARSLTCASTCLCGEGPQNRGHSAGHCNARTSRVAAGLAGCE